MAEGTGPVEGLKIVEFAHVVAGPLAGTLLADLGATVVHVESPRGGDDARRMGPANADGTYLWWKVGGRNKRSVTLDLRNPEGRELAYRLVEWADVAITNLRFDTLVEWGLDWPSLHALNRRLIMLQVSGYGATSSLRSLPGFGKMGEARSGVVHLTGFPDGPPVHTGFSHADSVTALTGGFGILAALFRQARDPEFDGEWIDIALFEPLYRLIEWQIIVQDQLGTTPTRAGNRLAVAPAAVINCYQAADGGWVTVTSATSKSVVSVVRMMGLAEEEFATREQQRARSDELDAALNDWIGARSTDDALRELAEAGVVASRIFTAADILEDDIYREREAVISIDDAELGPVRMQNVVPRFEQHPGAVWRTGPALGEDNRLVYGDWLGVDAAELERLGEAGII